jgi:Holliday junction DNA helicase RuvA
MISKLKGIVDEINSDSIVFNVQDVYYEIMINNSFLQKIKNEETMYIFTHYSIKEDSRSLYGFESKEDRDFFKFLIGIKGIGEKTVNNWLSAIDTDSLKRILYDEDLDALCKLPKVGRKTGEKIIIDIRHKIKTWNVTGVNRIVFNQEVMDSAVNALVSIGVPSQNAKDRAKELYTIGMNVSELVNAVLRK